MARGDCISVEVGGIAPGGAGIARYRGRVIFVRRGAPGERLRVRLNRDRGSWAEAEILEILDASPRRVRPRCPLYKTEGSGGCGGCSFQHLDYPFQVETKAGMLRESFRRLGDLPAEGLPGEILAFPSPAWEYRNRLKLHAVPLGDQDLPPGGRNLPARTPAVGFKSPQENQVVPVGDCPVADPGIRALLVRGELRAPPGRERFYVYGRQGLVLQEGGEDRGRLRIRDREFLMEAGLFFQSNAAMLEVLVEDLRALATGADRSLPLADLYCGVGTFGAFLSPLFPWVDGLEENRAALALARQNIGPGRHNFYGLTDNEWVKMLEAEDPARSYGLIVADPPRRGLSPPMRRWLARGPAPLLAYVSCDAATLARDSGELLRGAWELEELVCYDFYPQTAHIESLALFRRRRGR